MIKTKNYFKYETLKGAILAIAFLTLTTGCCRSLGFCPVEDATQAVIFGATELKQRQEIVLEDSCINYDHGITQLNLTFSSQDTVDLCQARFILVDVVDTYLRYFNDPIIFLPELKYPPFGPENLNIIITFESYYGQYVDLQYINQIRMYAGCVTYYDFNAFDPWGDVFHEHKEYYNNTRLIVNAQIASKYPVTHDHAALYMNAADERGKGLKSALGNKDNTSSATSTSSTTTTSPSGTKEVDTTTTTAPEQAAIRGPVRSLGQSSTGLSGYPPNVTPNTMPGTFQGATPNTVPSSSPPPYPVRYYDPSSGYPGTTQNGPPADHPVNNPPAGTSPYGAYPGTGAPSGASGATGSSGAAVTGSSAATGASGAAATGSSGSAATGSDGSASGISGTSTSFGNNPGIGPGTSTYEMQAPEKTPVQGN